MHSLRSSRDPFAWVAARRQAGADPRPLLEQLLQSTLRPPSTMVQEAMWDIIIHLLSDEEEFSMPPRLRLPDVSTMEDALRLLATCEKIVVLTGAGVSVSCGIPDFRSENGLYARLRRDFPSLPDPQAMFDMRFFRRDPRPFFKFAREIYPGQFEPSASHYFIRGLEKRGQLLRNYTQNIDTLEHACGLHRVIACHGGFSTATCTRCGYQVDCEALREDIFAQRVPLCPRCPQPEVQHWELPETDSSNGDVDVDSDLEPTYLRSGPDQMAVMKPDIVFFGEGLPREFHRCIDEDKDDADLLIVMGSSLKVRPVGSIPQRMERRVPQILINREPLAHIDPFDVQLLGDCDVVIRELCSRLKGWEHEEWLDRGKPSTEPAHPYTIVELRYGEPIPKDQPFIYRIADNTYAFSGAEPRSLSCLSDDDDEEDDSECSDSELIESLVDSLVSQVASENFNLGEDDAAVELAQHRVASALGIMGDLNDEESQTPQYKPLADDWESN
ncbi:NAD-dependent protein deacetylase sirtuin-1-like [Tropilaelaps mercedesae]|uniref:protein acetyllysine N-acetyltransferase n=1 Tax=Tropilaelaps mercedesae TaxID=418985 RepID=A0A1V9X7H7_9ACAR|nr:NAD-dependent protein deacetylase sirtuin-1-like [Tropilaelaps mercedesae]